ncbi:hypothetical protein pb186bvf_005061 [Paramecium bursaria]
MDQEDDGEFMIPMNIISIYRPIFHEALLLRPLICISTLKQV